MPKTTPPTHPATDRGPAEEQAKIFRDLLLGFVKIHVLYHASQEPIFGVGITQELEQHGYRLSPGTLYPLLHNLERANFLEREERIVGGKIRKYYVTTPLGERALAEARAKAIELVQEVAGTGAAPKPARTAPARRRKRTA